MTLPEGALGSEASTSFNKYRQHIFIIEGGWYGGVSYECRSYDPEYEISKLVYGGPGTKKKDIVKWLKRRHSQLAWTLKTSHNRDGDHWEYVFTRIKPTGPEEDYCTRCWSRRVQIGIRRVMQMPSGREYHATMKICDDCDYTETINMEEIEE